MVRHSALLAPAPAIDVPGPDVGHGLAGCAGAAAQDSRGSIGGRVADSSGGVLPGATVTIVNNATNSTTVVITGEGGMFTAPFLISGSYKVTVELPGFRTTVRETVDVRVGDRLQVDFTLRPGEHLDGNHRRRRRRRCSTPAPRRWGR